MPLDNELVLLGTGLAPLVAASHLISEGKSVLLLNPDFDFFLEESELPLDPLLSCRDVGRVKNSRSEEVLSGLRPGFPGAVEFSSTGPGGAGKAASDGFRDLSAPHVRSRGRLFIGMREAHWGMREAQWLDDFYLEASDAGLNPQLWEGLLASRRFPGISKVDEEVRGLLVPGLCDVDVVRYRNGILEYVRERLGPERFLSNVTQIELVPDGVRFYASGQLQTVKHQGMLVFWTPKLTQWVLTQAKRSEVSAVLPRGVRIWEEWSVLSRFPVDSAVVGVVQDMAVWADLEGAPSTNASDEHHQVNVLRGGEVLPIELLNDFKGAMNWASAESFNALSWLFHSFLKWEHATIRNMKPRMLFEWENQAPWLLSKPGSPGRSVRVIPGSDGPIFDVVRAARKACEGFKE